MKLTQRQAQVALLSQHGASSKEIAAVLGIEPSTVKTYKKQVLKICREHNRDVFGLPVKNAERLAEFQKLNRKLLLTMRFGDVSEQ